MCDKCGKPLNVEQLKDKIAEKTERFTVIEEGDSYILYDGVLQEDAFETKDYTVFVMYVNEVVFGEHHEHHYHIHK